jgi:uncharacterized protein
MKPFVSMLIWLVAACSDGQATSQSRPVNDVQHLATTAQPKIALSGRVTDAARILDDAQEASLSNRLEQLERKTGHQMVVITVPTLGGKDVTAFTQELGNVWGIGRAEHDDGVILLVAPNERKARIAVGYGLEKTLPDALCEKIMDDRILPRFGEGDLAGGIEAGASAIIERLE